ARAGIFLCVVLRRGAPVSAPFSIPFLCIWGIGWQKCRWTVPLPLSPWKRPPALPKFWNGCWPGKDLTVNSPVVYTMPERFPQFKEIYHERTQRQNRKPCLSGNRRAAGGGSGKAAALAVPDICHFGARHRAAAWPGYGGSRFGFAGSPTER